MKETEEFIKSRNLKEKIINGVIVMSLIAVVSGVVYLKSLENKLSNEAV